MTKVEISTLLSRYSWNLLTSDERRKLFDWVNASGENFHTFKRSTDRRLIMARVDSRFLSNEKVASPIIQRCKISRLFKKRKKILKSPDLNRSRKFALKMG